MPRPKKPGDESKEIKKRSRNGCWPCKARKVKCGEEKPSCASCVRQGEHCDYSIRLNWDGRSKKKDTGPGTNVISFASQPSSSQSSRRTSKDDAHPSLGLPAAFSAASESFGSKQVTPPQSRSSSLDHSLPSISHFSQVALPPESLNQSARAPLAPPNPTWADAVPGMSSLGQRYPLQSAAYPSPAESSFDSPSTFSNGVASTQTTQMLPPLTAASQAPLVESVNSPYSSAKRMRLSPKEESWQKDIILMSRTLLAEDLPGADSPSHLPTSYLSNSSTPLTPGTSSGSYLSADNEDRRISVSSLLSEGINYDRRTSAVNIHSSAQEPSFASSSFCSETETKTYGRDGGLPDLDIPRHNDEFAISGETPHPECEFDSWLEQADIGIPEFGFGLPSREVVFAKGGYYASPVSVKIPHTLQPLPPALQDHPMNLLYFHHFLNHTARILVPHDCPENPFKTVLPKMALEDPHLLNLLLAYSACHRARLLGHPEPKNRIALWVRDLFPHLRQTLQSPSEKVSNASLATAIMLASLEIISPSSFEIQVPWHVHLGLARNIIRARCGPFSVSRTDRVMYFLTRWLAYLDVIGSLSGIRKEEPLFAGNYWSSGDSSSSGRSISYSESMHEDEYDEEDNTIDCVMGFTTRCVSILAQVASLVHQCTESRMDHKRQRINDAWQPSAIISQKARNLLGELEAARNREPHHCPHHSPTLPRSTLAQQRGYVDICDNDAEESIATNHAYHWAGQVHLLRRVYNLPRSDPHVQQAVREIIQVISTLREGGSAMACILFPMFTAGVEAELPLDRHKVLSRVESLEELGMFQVSRAKKVMEESWRTGISWEFLVNGEFLG